MAHKLLPVETVERKRKKLNLPYLGGKFGLALFIGNKEVFIGVQIGEVEVEKIIRKRFVSSSKAKVRVMQFDSSPE